MGWLPSIMETGQAIIPLAGLSISTYPPNMTYPILSHPVTRAVYEAGQATRSWSDQQDWRLIRREAREAFTAAVALVYTLGIYTGLAFHWLNVKATRATRYAAGVRVEARAARPEAKPEADHGRLTVAELRKLARTAGQSRAWCRVARRADLLAYFGE